MALLTATRTFNLRDYLGDNYDPRRTKVYATTNVVNDRIIDTSTGDFYLGSGTTLVGIDGDVSVTVPVPGTSNPASWQTTVHIDYADKVTKERKVLPIGPFTITTSGLLADLVDEQEVQPEYLTTVTQQLDAKVAEAEAARDLAVDISNIDSTDTAVAAGFQIPGSASGAYLSTTFATRALSAQTRPRGRRGILTGDSITAYNGGPSTATPVQATSSYDSKGMWRWATVMLNQRIDIIGNSGIGGQETAAILARFDTDVLAYNPDWVSILAGTNDDGPEDNTVANLKAMYEAALGAGIYVIAFTVPPAGGGELGTYRQGVNTWIKEYAASTPGITVVDLAAAWQDTSVGGFVAQASYLHDGIHPNTLGAQVAGREIANTLDLLFPPNLDALPDATAPASLLSNTRFAGSGSSSSPPTGWSIAVGAATFSYVARGDGKPGQRLAVTVPIGGSVTITSNVNKGVLLREGDDYDFTVVVEPYDIVMAGLGTQRINAFTQNYTGSAFTDRKDAVYVDGGANYASARYPLSRGVWRTQRATLTSGKTLAQVAIVLAGGGTYLVSDPIMRNLTMLEAGITAPENVTHTNLVTNGDFETDLTDWTVFGGATIARDTTAFVKGVAAMAVTNAADINSDARFKKVPITVASINYSLWVKAPSGHLGKLNFNWFVGGGSYLSVTSVAWTGTGQWVHLLGTVPASSVPGTAGEVLVSVARGDATGTPVVHVDAVDIWQ